MGFLKMVDKRHVTVRRTGCTGGKKIRVPAVQRQVWQISTQKQMFKIIYTIKLTQGFECAHVFKNFRPGRKGEGATAPPPNFGTLKIYPLFPLKKGHLTPM